MITRRHFLGALGGLAASSTGCLVARRDPPSLDHVHYPLGLIPRTGGQGIKVGADRFVFPPLWGPQSFNVGAGMARLSVAAAFVRAQMPPGNTGTLTDQEAYDVAAYFTTQPRPDFPGKENDWPAGGRPADAR